MSRSEIVRRRRLGALIATVAATAVLWLLLFGGDDNDASSSARLTGAQHSKRAARLLDRLQPAAKVDQILLLGFDGTDGSGPVADELADRDIGGLLVGAANWTDVGQGTALVAKLRELAADGSRRIPPLIVAAQEGGDHRTFADLPPADRQLNIGDFADPQLAEDWAAETTTALSEIGFSLNLSPVADVATIDSPIADRAFSDDPAIAAVLTAAAVRGCRRSNFACAPTHFPGIGAASQDPADGPATVSLDETTLIGRDIAPFVAAFSERVPAVVISHAFYAAYDPVTPASLSPEVMIDLLRDQLGFGGVAITGDLDSGAIRSSYRVPEAAVLAIAAGADMVTVSAPADQRRLADALIDAVASGELSSERLDEAAGRVLDLKISLGLIS